MHFQIVESLRVFHSYHLPVIVFLGHQNSFAQRLLLTTAIKPVVTQPITSRIRKLRKLFIKLFNTNKKA